MKYLLAIIFITVGCSSMPKKHNALGVDFKNLKNEQTIKNNYNLQFEVKGMKVHPAGALKADTGHHHLIIDQGYIAKGAVVPKDAKHIHFGGGQTSTVLKLSPGKHTLTLQFADGNHISYGKQWSKTIKITVLPN